MKQIKFLGVLAVALTLGLSACGGAKECSKHQYGEWKETKAATCTEDGTKERVCTKCGHKDEGVIKAGHKYGEWDVTKEATCLEVGSRTRTCSVCGDVQTEEIPLADHNYGEWTIVTPADCETAGEQKRECTVCGNEDTETIPATGHSYTKDADGNDVVTWTKKVSCEEDGVGTKHCETCGKDVAYTETKLGHHLVQQADDGTQAKEDFAKVRVYECDREGCDYATFGFSANEVSAEAGRLVDEEVTEDDGTVLHGKRFWGRPIGNAMELGEDGSASGADATKVFDRTVQGDLFLYKFTLSQAQVDALGSDIACYADAKPADYLGGQDFWACDPSAEEWTPGYYIDDAHEDQVAIADYRYILYVDGQPVEFDHNITAPVPRSGYSSTNLPRGNFIMPYIFHFTAGDHSISLRMAGGYRSIFFNFIFKSYEAPEPPEPQHVHEFANETDVAAKGEGYVGYKTGTCAEDNAKRINIRALDGTFAEGSANKTGNGAPIEGYMKLAKNENSISYKFDYAGQAATAKLYQYGYMDNFSSNGDRTYTSAQDSSKLAKSPTGTNFAVKFNNVDVAISDATKATTYTQFFAGATVSPGGSGNSNLAACYIGDIQLQNGDNTFIFTRYESFNLSVSNFYLVIE